jgi:hypothetical protein
MMHGPEESDSVIVAVKPTNKAESSVAEPAEPRTGTKGKADQQSTRGAQDREAYHRRWNAYGKSLGKERKNGSPQATTPSPMAKRALCLQTPKVEAECPNWACSDLSGGRSEMSVPTGNARERPVGSSWRLDETYVKVKGAMAESG